MSPLLIVAALAAQTATPPTTPASTTTDTDRKSGESNYIDLEAGAGYSSNPNLSIVNDEGSAFGRISLRAVHSRVSALSTTLLSAFAEDVSYTNHHGSQPLLSLNALHNVAVSEHVRLFGDANVTYQEGGQLDTRVLDIPTIPPLPGGVVTPPILVLPSGDFLSVTGRQYSFAGHGGGTFALSGVDSLSLSSGIEHVVFHSGTTRTSYTTIPVSISYDRQLGERTTVGARVTGRDTEYNGPANFRVVSPQLTARLLLAARLTLDGALGASFARVDDGITVRHSTGFAGNLNLCGQGEFDYYCAHFAADEQTATTAGPARSLSGSIDYTHRIGPNESVQLSLGVTHYSTPTSVIVGRTFSSASYYHAAGSYSRRLSGRLFGGVNLSARKLAQIGPDPKTDLNASLFLRYRIGDIQ